MSKRVEKKIKTEINDVNPNVHKKNVSLYETHETLIHMGNNDIIVENLVGGVT